MHQQDDSGTDADVLLTAIANSKRGYAFVGVTGNEEGALAPKHDHGLVTLLVTENQMGAMCTKGDKHCKHPCDPAPPSGAGPWNTIDINNLHREYIQGVPGYFWQHPTTDPQREQMLAHMQSGQDNLRGMEVYNAWEEQAWDVEMPRDDADIDPIYPVYESGDCTAWSEYQHSGSCQLHSSIQYWDSTLRALKRPIYGLADDDGFVYTGDSEDAVHKHKKKDVQTDTPSWFRFGVAWSMVDVPNNFSAMDVSEAVDAGRFYASTGVDLSYDTSGDIISVSAGEPVVFAATGGVGDEAGASPLAALNVTLCTGSDGIVSNVGCGGAMGVPSPARELRIDLREISGSFFYVRVQALVRTRYLITSAPSSKASKWEFELSTTPNAADVMEGRPLRATGKSRRPLIVQSVDGNKVRVVKHFSTGYGEITPDQTTVTGIVGGQDQLVAERWAWMQPVFRKIAANGRLVDYFTAEVFV